jgi:hypothetical protein
MGLGPFYFVSIIEVCSPWTLSPLHKASRLGERGSLFYTVASKVRLPPRARVKQVNQP